MIRTSRLLLAALSLLLSGLVFRAEASTLVKADIERMVDYFYIVGEIQPDIPVYPLFVKDPAAPDSKPELKAYVFETIDFAPVRGYSAKPMNVLIIMDLTGTLLKVRLIDHREPLFLDSAGTAKLERFASQYKGLTLRHSVEVRPFNDPGQRTEEVAHVKGVQQGTISVKAINRAIVTAAAAVGAAKLKAAADTAADVHASPPPEPKTQAAQAQAHREEPKAAAEGSDTKNDSTKDSTKLPARELARTTPNEAKAEPASAAAATAAPAAPDKTLKAMATTPAANQEAATLSDVTADTASASAPAPASDAVTAAPTQLASPLPVMAAPAADTPDWLPAWESRVRDIAILAAALVLLSAALIAQKRFSANSRRMRVLRTAYLLFTVGFIGWTAQGQLTVVNIAAALESLTHGGDLSFLMNDPISVILWIFVGITLLIWGRGTFCGWLCPFGALQELIALVTNAIGVRQRRLRAALDTRLKAVKYLILATLMTSVFVAPSFAELGMEVEPFKTAISLYFMRDWPYVLWAAGCLLLGTVIYRGYCRYICPLGAALASMNFLRRWSWIPRRDACGAPCQSCRHRCEYQAIAPTGEINYRECFQCLDCVAIYQDDQRCLPLIKERRLQRSVIPIHATVSE